MRFGWPVYGKIEWRLLQCFCIASPLLINAIYFGKSYFLSVPRFIMLSLVACLAMSANFIVAQLIALLLGRRFPNEKLQWLKRSLSIIVTTIISILLVFVFYRGIAGIAWFNAPFDDNNFAWACVSLALINIFFTFLMEGVSSYLHWLKNEDEKERLSEVYQHNQLSGLKSQVNPHFLFNSLNTLSSLLHDNDDAAERFLDEMSKVYRYMFRNSDEPLVPLASELNFLDSYVYLLRTRYTGGILVHTAITNNCRDKLVTPLILQVVLENILQQNVISKSNPLKIEIGCTDEGSVFVKSNIQPKLVPTLGDNDNNLAGLVDKYRLLNRSISISEIPNKERTITIPLIDTE